MDERKLIEELLRDRPDMDEFLRKTLEEKLRPEPMPLDDDETCVIVGDWPSLINGSKMVRCDTCKSRCSMAPSTQQSLKDYKGTVRLLCLKCFQENPPEGTPELTKSIFAASPDTEEKFRPPTFFNKH